MSQKYWEYPIEFYLKGEYELSKAMGKPFKHYEPNAKVFGNHFSSSLKFAESYALQKDKPVILTLDWDRNECAKDFIIRKKIDTSLVHALDRGMKKYSYYGTIINALYKRVGRCSRSDRMVFLSTLPSIKATIEAEFEMLRLGITERENYGFVKREFMRLAEDVDAIILDF